MADLKNKQLQERYQTLLTTSVTTADPKTGTLQNGDGSDILELTIDAGTNGNNALKIDKSNASAGNLLSLQGAAGNINLAHTGQAITFSTAGTITATGSNDLNLVSGQRVAVDATHSDGLYVDANITCTSNISGGSITGTGTIKGIGTYTAGNSIKIFEAERSGGAVASDWSYDDASTDMSLGTSTAHSFSLKTSDTNRLTIDSSGNVGINGTPSDKLEVAGLSNYTGLTLKGNASSRPALTFKNVNQSLLGSIYGTEGRALAFESGGDGTTGVLAMTIDSSGNVGIGTTSPNQLLEVANSSGGATVNISTDQAAGSVASKKFNNIDFSGYNNSVLARIQSWDESSSTGHGYLTFHTFKAGGSLTEQMRIDYDGNVGIGTDSPTDNLHVGTSSGGTQLKIESGLGTNCALIYETGGVDSWRLGMNLSGPTGSFQFYDDVANTTRMLIDSSGNVGIGTTSPSAKLEVQDGSISVGSSTNTSTTNALLSGYGYILSGTKIGNTSITSTYNNSNNSASLEFYTDPNGSTPTERMRIDSSGNVGIGNTDPDHPLTVTAGPSSAGVPVAWIHNSTNSADHDGTVISSTNDGADAEVLHVRANNTTYSNGTSLMLVRGDGNVGFGTTSPDEPVHVAKSTGDAIIAVEANDGNAALYLTSAGSGKDNRIVSGNAKALKFEVQSAGSGQGQGQDPVATGTTVMTLTNSGNVLVAKTSASRTTVGHEFHSSGFARHTALEDKSLEIVRTSTDGEMVEFFKDSTQVGTIGVTSGSFAIGQTNTGIGFFNGDRIAFPATSAGVAQDNAIDLGYSGARFDDIYATNGTIQTSDVNEKQDIEELSEAELRVAQKAKTLIRKYRWKSSVEEKGDDARIHFGIIAQDLEQAFTDEGLDAGRYGMFIKSTWTNEDGEEQTRLGVRYNQLLAFIISAI